MTSHGYNHFVNFVKNFVNFVVKSYLCTIMKWRKCLVMT